MYRYAPKTFDTTMYCHYTLWECSHTINFTNIKRLCQKTSFLRIIIKLAQCSISIPPWKRRKTFGFLIFSRGIEMEQCAKWANKARKWSKSSELILPVKHLGNIFTRYICCKSAIQRREQNHRRSSGALTVYFEHD